MLRHGALPQKFGVEGFDVLSNVPTYEGFNLADRQA
jgi:hypothetical protein